MFVRKQDFRKTVLKMVTLILNCLKTHHGCHGADTVIEDLRPERSAFPFK